MSPDKHEAQDPSGFIVITVDRSRLVTNVRIRSHWTERIKPEAFPATLYNTYVTAVQRALAADTGNTPASPPSSPAATAEDLTGLPPEEQIARMKSWLDDLDDEREAVLRSARQAPRLVDTEVRSPLGHLTLRMRAGGPIAITADPHVLRNPSETVLSDEILQMFVQAGLGTAAPQRPRTTRPHEADDDYFEAVHVFDDRD